MFEKHPLHPLAKHHLKQGTVEKDTTTTNFTDNKNQKMEMGRTHPKKKGNQYDKTGTKIEPPETLKTGNTWRRGLHTELKTIGKTWNEAKKNQQKTERSGKKLQSPNVPLWRKWIKSK